MRLWVFFRESMKAKSFFAPMTNRALERASAFIMVSVSTVVDVMPIRG
jgi:hypothetical protein